MGITMFIFSACIAFYLWIEQSQQIRWLLMAAFFMGVAVGSKYQTLTFLPIFFIFLLTRDRKLSTLFLASFCLVTPCIYWYARNGILTGDPFNPIGGKLFGFTDWNFGDYEYQFAALERVSGWPQWAFWAAPLSILIKECRDTRIGRAAIVFCIYAFAVWMVTSRYPRYLMPAFPLMALLAAVGWHWLLTFGFSRIRLLNNAQTYTSKHTRLQITGWTLILLFSLAAALLTSSSKWNLIASTETAREKILDEKINGYQTLSYLRKHSSGKTYQFGLEGSIYYAPSHTWGDHFGPGRYRDFASLNSADLARKLHGLGFKNLVINIKEWPGIDTQSNFNCHFSLVYEATFVRLYHINEKLQC